MVGYNQENLKLHIVPVNGTTVPTSATEIEKQLNAFYNPAVINWKVSMDSSLEVGGLASPFDNGSSGVLSTYTGDMKAVINTYLNNNKLEDDNYYLFLVPKGTNTTEDGYMPRSKQCGFIFIDTEENDPAKTVRAMAHELGHGAFTLKHTFVDYPALVQGSTDNLMDYGSGTTLLKYQWDVIHNPRIVLGVFENDDAGASYACTSNWFDASSLPSAECDDVGKLLEKIRKAIGSGKKILVGRPIEGKNEIATDAIKLNDEDYKTVRIQNFLKKDESIVVDPTLHEDFDPDAVSSDRLPGISFKVDGKPILKIYVGDKDLEAAKQKREALRKYLFESPSEIFLSNVQFTSQFDESLFGQCTGCWKNSCCMRACNYMLGNIAVANCSDATTANSSPNVAFSEIITMGQFSDNSINYDLESYNAQTLNFNPDRLISATKYIKERLNAEKPVLIGCHYKAEKGNPPNNPNRATRHFMIIVGTSTANDGKVRFRFYDPGVFPESQDVGADPDNLLTVDSLTGTISGTYQGKTYSITEIFKTN